MTNTNDSLSYSHPVCACHYSDEFFDADVPMYLEHAQRSGSPILELGSGAGRLLIPLAQAGFRVVGLDLYAPMLKAAGEKIAKLDGIARRRIGLIQADMSHFSLKRCFNMAYISANTMFHLSRQKQRECLKCVRDALRPGGQILIDCESPSSIATASECIGMLSRCDDYSENASGRVASVRSWIIDVDLAERLMYTRTEITEKSCDRDVKKRTYNYTLHWFDKDELERLLAECGFRRTHIYGDWDMRHFSEGDHRMIFVADRA
jgi:SAM-dependent methyltransferase